MSNILDGGASYPEDLDFALNGDLIVSRNFYDLGRSEVIVLSTGESGAYTTVNVRTTLPQGSDTAFYYYGRSIAVSCGRLYVLACMEDLDVKIVDFKIHCFD